MEKQIDALLDRIVTATSASVVAAYEARIENLERQKFRLSEQSEQTVPPQGRMGEFIEHALTFMENPWKLYEKGGLALRRTVLKLVFPAPLIYSRETGYRTPEIAFPFKVLLDTFHHGKCLVEQRGRVILTGKPYAFQSVTLHRSP